MARARRGFDTGKLFLITDSHCTPGCPDHTPGTDSLGRNSRRERREGLRTAIIGELGQMGKKILAQDAHCPRLTRVKRRRSAATRSVVARKITWISRDTAGSGKLLSKPKLSKIKALLRWANCGQGWRSSSPRRLCFPTARAAATAGAGRAATANHVCPREAPFTGNLKTTKHQKRDLLRSQWEARAR